MDTTATVLLGLTLGCARCHDHKYDPITQKEFYQLFAYFNNVPESGKGRRDRQLAALYRRRRCPSNRRQLKRLDDQLAAANAAFAKLQPDLVRAQRQWERTLDPSKPVTWASAEGLVAYYPLDGDLSTPVFVPAPPPPAAAPRPNAPRTPTSAPGGASPATPAPTPDTPSDTPSPAPAAGPTPGQNEVRFVPGQIGQAASFDGKGFIFGGDVAGFAEYGTESAIALPTRRPSPTTTRTRSRRGSIPPRRPARL